MCTTCVLVLCTLSIVANALLQVYALHFDLAHDWHSTASLCPEHIEWRPVAPTCLLYRVAIVGFLPVIRGDAASRSASSMSEAPLFEILSRWQTDCFVFLGAQVLFLPAFRPTVFAVCFFFHVRSPSRCWLHRIGSFARDGVSGHARDRADGREGPGQCMQSGVEWESLDLSARVEFVIWPTTRGSARVWLLWWSNELMKLKRVPGKLHSLTAEIGTLCALWHKNLTVMRRRLFVISATLGDWHPRRCLPQSSDWGGASTDGRRLLGWLNGGPNAR